MYKTASTIAAYEGRTEVNVEDVREAAQMALLHRQRRLPFQQTQMVTDQLDSVIEDHQNQNRNREPQNPQNNTEESGDSSEPDHIPNQMIVMKPRQTRQNHPTPNKMNTSKLVTRMTCHLSKLILRTEDQDRSLADAPTL